MKLTFTKLLLTLFTMISPFIAQAQALLKGRVVDAENHPLPKASVSVSNTHIRTLTDADGAFSLQTAEEEGALEISFSGMENKSVPFSAKNLQTQDLGLIALRPIKTDRLEEIVFVGSKVLGLAKDRQTPIAVSTIKGKEIREKLGNQEFPEILRSVPSIYTSKGGGGFGDSRVSLRGFDRNNIAVMINGQPVNDMENGRVFWSNWSGLQDIASAIQVQRGVGSSKLAVSSVGGTINIITKINERKQGGLAQFAIGDNHDVKITAAYSTGLSKKGWGASFLLSQRQGNGYVDGAAFNSYTYFFSLGYIPTNSRHAFNLMFAGAPQWHDQRASTIALANYLKHGDGHTPNIRYNNSWGYLDNRPFNWNRNNYHKPVAQFNWDWKINDKFSLNSVLYGSWGRGGGTAAGGKINPQLREYNFSPASLPINSDGLQRFDDIIKWNKGQNIADFGPARKPWDKTSDYNGQYVSTKENGMYQTLSFNIHNWYGLLSNLNYTPNERWIFDLGLDLRMYRSALYQTLSNLMGSDAFYDTSDVNDPGRFITQTSPTKFFRAAARKDRIFYNNAALIRWGGLFGQAEYKTNQISAFAQGALSNQFFKRIDFFKYRPSEERRETPWHNRWGGNIKGGFNINLNSQNNLFVNAGYYNRQPDFRSVFPNYDQIYKKDIKNESVASIEAGYGFKNNSLKININAYRTVWYDRFIAKRDFLTLKDQDGKKIDEIWGTANLNGIGQIHQGIELEAFYQLFSRLRLKGQFSYGDWRYKDNVTADYFDDNNQRILDPVSGQPMTKTLYLDKNKVGDAAQLTIALGFDLQLTKKWAIDAGWNHFDQLYGGIDISKAFEKYIPLRLPAYSLVDAGMTYIFSFEGKKEIKLRINVNNLFDKIYISESSTNIPVSPDTKKTWRGIDARNLVFFGFGRTWNASLTFNF